MSAFLIEMASRLGVVGGAVGIGVVLLTYLLWPPGSAKVIRKKPIESGDASLPKYGKGPYSITAADGEAAVRYAKSGPASEGALPAMTIPQVFALAAEKKGDKIAMRVESPVPPLDGRKAPPATPLETWKSWTFKQYYAEARMCAKSMIKLGLGQFDSVNIWGFNSPEWFLGDVAAILAGGKAAGIYPTDTPESVSFKCQHSASSIILVEHDEMLASMIEMVDDLPDLKAIVVWSQDPSQKTITRKTRSAGEVAVLSWSEFMAYGSDVEDKVLQERMDAQKPGHCCTLIYTSGTTGNPKAVMISHDNILYEARCVAAEMPMVGNDGTEERIISYLPLSHVAGMMVDIVCPIVVSAFQSGWMSANFARPYDLKVGTIGDRLKCVKPTVFLGVPRVWEKIAEKMMAIGKSTKGTKLKIAKWSKGKGLEHAQATNLPGYAPAWAEGGTAGDGVRTKQSHHNSISGESLTCCLFVSELPVGLQGGGQARPEQGQGGARSAGVQVRLHRRGPDHCRDSRVLRRSGHPGERGLRYV